MLSFVEKRNFFQRLSLTSEKLPLSAKWTQEVSMDDIPMAQGEIVKEQISFEDKLKMFEPDEEKRRKAQKRDKQEQPTVYRYDFTKSNKDTASTAEHAVSELDKAEQIVKQVNNKLIEEECHLMIENLDSKSERLPENQFDSAFTLENIEQEVSSLLAEVDKEERELSRESCVEKNSKAKKPMSLECKSKISHPIQSSVNDDLDTSCGIMNYFDSAVETPETLLSLSAKNESEKSYEFMGLSENVLDVNLHHLQQDSAKQASAEDLEETKCSPCSVPQDYVTPDQPSTVRELQEKKSLQWYPEHFSSSSKESVGSIIQLEGESLISENELESIEQKVESEHESDNHVKDTKLHDPDTQTFAPQHFDISEKLNNHIKTQILHEELDQVLEESPLEVKHIAEDIEHLLAAESCHTKEVLKQIRTEIFSQELGEDIESGSPEKKNISLDTVDGEITPITDEQTKVKDTEDSVSPQVFKIAVIASENELVNINTDLEGATFSDQNVSDVLHVGELDQKVTSDQVMETSFDDENISPNDIIVVEHDDYLKDYEEAKEEHSLSEQLLALASDVRRTSKCLDSDELFSESCSSSHTGFEHTLSNIRSQSESELHRRSDADVLYSRTDKKEMRLLKSTKQVSTIEEHSSVESNDSSQELIQPEVSSPDIVAKSMNLRETSDSHEFPFGSKEGIFLTEKDVDVSDRIEGGTEIAISSTEEDFFVKDSPIVDNSSLSDEDMDSHKVPLKDKFPKDSDKSYRSKDKSKDDKKSDSDPEGAKADDDALSQRKEESFSSSGETESPYYSVETSGYERTPRSTPAASRPCSSEFEINILSGHGSEYETCATSQDVSGEVSGSYATAATSQETTSYSTACSSLSHSSRESAYSVDSESSGHLGSIEVSSEASETLVPSAQEMECEFGQDTEMPVLDEDSVLVDCGIKEPYDTYIPESVIRSGIELPFMKNWDLQQGSSEGTVKQLHDQWSWHDTREAKLLDSLSEMREECKNSSSDIVENVGEEDISDHNHQPYCAGKADCDDMDFRVHSPSLYEQDEGKSVALKTSVTSMESEEQQGVLPPAVEHVSMSLATLDDDRPDVTSELIQEKENVVNQVDEEQLSVSESSATHSEQTWQTSSIDTAFHVSSSIPTSCFPLEGHSATAADALPDILLDRSRSSSERDNQPFSPESQYVNPALSYLQLNGPVEVDFNPEYDAIDDESAPQGDEVNASYQPNHKSTDQSEFGSATQTTTDSAALGDESSFPCDQVYFEEPSKVDEDSFCSAISVEAEKPEAQQEQVLSYQDYEECFQPEGATLSDDTTYLPESEQCNLRNILVESSDFLQQDDIPQEPSHEISCDFGLNEEVVDAAEATSAKSDKVEVQSEIQNADMADKADILDTSPEDDRYDYKNQESKQKKAYKVHEAHKYEMVLVSSEETAVELVDQNLPCENEDLDHTVQESYDAAGKELYTHQEGEIDVFECEDRCSGQVPSPVPSGDDDKQSTPSFDMLPARRFFPKSGDHDGSSASSSLKEFENLEAEMAAGRSSRASSDSFDKPPTTKSGEHDDISMGSLNEFEKLEQDCVEAEQVDQIESEAVGMLSEIEEGHESQASDGQETLSDDGHDQGSDNSDDYEKRMIEIDEIIRMAQNNVEKFHDEELDDFSEGVTLEEFTVTQRTQTSNDNSTESSVVDRLPFPKKVCGTVSLSTTAPDCPSKVKDETDSNSSSKHSSDKFALPASSVEEFTEQLFGVSHSAAEFSVTDGTKLLEMEGCHDLENQELYGDLRVGEQIDDEAMEALAFDTMKGGSESDGILWSEKIKLNHGMEEGELLTDSLETDNGIGGGQDSSSSGEKNSCSGKGDCMVSSTDSIDPSSSTATHATYQFETDSVMSSSINSAQASGEECTMVSSTDTLEPEPKLSYSQGDLIDEEATSSEGMISNVNCVKMSCFESESSSTVLPGTLVEKLEYTLQSENAEFDISEKVAGFLEKRDESFKELGQIPYDFQDQDIIHHTSEKFEVDEYSPDSFGKGLGEVSQNLITSLISEKTDLREQTKEHLRKFTGESQEHTEEISSERLCDNPSLIETNTLSNNDQPFPLDSYSHPISSASQSLHYPAPCDLSSLSSEMTQPQAPAFGFFQPDEESHGDEDVVSRTTTTTRIVTTVTTEDGDELKEQVTEEGGDELRHSMEVILDQFMHEDASDTQSSQPQ